MASRKNAMLKWLALATPEQKRQLAKAAGTSRAHLTHLGSGFRSASADLAQRLSAASRTLPKPLRLDQQDLCKACGKCPLVPKAK